MDQLGVRMSRLAQTCVLCEVASQMGAWLKELYATAMEVAQFYTIINTIHKGKEKISSRLLC